jgi:hypothetical protein
VADDVTLPGTGTVVATRDVSGREWQEVTAAAASQAATTGTFTANGNTITISTLERMFHGALFQISGTYGTGITAQFEVSYDGGTTYDNTIGIRIDAVLGVPAVSTAPGANGVEQWLLNCPGATHVRVRVSAWAAPSGTANVRLTPFAGVLPVVGVGPGLATQPVSGTVTATGVAGVAAHDAVVSGNPLLVAGYAAGNPTTQSAVSASGDVVRITADLNGNAWVHPAHATTRIAVTVTTGTSVYASGDAVGAELTFAAATRFTGGGGLLVGAMVVDAGDTWDQDLDLVLFSATVVESADNAAAAYTDAETLTLVGKVDFPVADAVDVGGARVLKVDGLAIPYNCAATSLFGQLIARGALAAPATTTSYTVVLWVLPD